MSSPGQPSTHVAPVLNRLETGSTPDTTLTPAMRQYVEQKQRVGDAVLLFRMGDFYETFYEDAVLCSKVLGIALTSRSKGTNPIPLAGIPYHALDAYLRKLVVAGYRVAISEQLEDPKQAKGVVRRDVVRIVTAGTLTEEGLLNELDDNFLAAICLRGESAGLAIVELAGGRFEVLTLSPDALLDELVRARVAELLIDDQRDGPAQRVAEQVRELCGTTITRRPLHEFSKFQAEQSLLAHFEVSTLAGFGFDGGGTPPFAALRTGVDGTGTPHRKEDLGTTSIDPSLCAAGCVVQYLRETQKTSLGHITTLRRRVSGDSLQIDHNSFRALEIERTLRSGQRQGTLLWAIDRTVHPIGGRKLAHWLRAPLICEADICARLDAVGFLVDNDRTRAQVRKALKSMADVERIAGRVALSRTTPRDLKALGSTLEALPAVGELLRDCRVEGKNDRCLTGAAEDLEGHGDLANLLRRAIRPDPAATLREGGVIADGFDSELDRLRAIGRHGKGSLAEYQQRESKRTGLGSLLKVGFNRVFGYYLEVPNSAQDRVPPEYVRKQTIKNAQRYITDELKKYETEVLSAGERAIELEVQLFEGVRQQVADGLKPLMRLAEAIGLLDCLAGLAELAIQRRYVRPQFVSGNTSEEGKRQEGRGKGESTIDNRQSTILDIRDGRHPVLDQTLADSFVPNDCLMSSPDATLFVITGPNMAGKSTYIRQVALLSLLAQIGSFVPAGKMTLSIVDRIFARVGSSDEIMRGRSTFMVEMSETANILHNATNRSLVVLDELGRGTSTFDGLSLAWAITEHLAGEIKCRCLVATHYHEMTELAQLLTGIRNYNVAVRELSIDDCGSSIRADSNGQSPIDNRQPSIDNAHDEGIVFLHAIVEGGASKSYGIHVAKLAGICQPVIERSRQILDELQRGPRSKVEGPKSKVQGQDVGPRALELGPSTDPQLSLFREPGAELLEELHKIDPDRITPIDALRTVKAWKDRFGV